MKDLIKIVTPYVGSLFRKALVAGGTYLASHGITTAESWQTVVDSSDALVGVGLVLTGCLWSLVNKWLVAREAARK